ncbi:MAG: hypothetical protein AAB948_01885 [Patescibacteria group bacterium]
MNSKTKIKIFAILMGINLFSVASVFAANPKGSGLTVCGNSTTSQIQTYQDWLIQHPKNGVEYQAKQDQWYIDEQKQRDLAGMCAPKDIYKQIGRIINFLVGISTAYLVFKLAFAGYIMAVFKGNETALTEAKTQIGHSITGMVLIFGAYLTVMTFFGDIFGVNIRLPLGINLFEK